MKIHVTEEDIKNGVSGDCYACPIARALNRAGFPGSLVFSDRADIGGRDRVAIVPLSRRSQGFVQRFDKRKPVKPFAFLLAASPDVPKEAA